MNETETNHFVSQVYLKAFLQENGKLWTTARIERGWDKIREKTSAQVCYQKDLYSQISDDGLDRNSLENQCGLKYPKMVRTDAQLSMN